MTIIRNILAVIAGAVLGSFANMAIVIVGPMLVPPPAGVDMTTVEGVKAAMPLLQTKHLIAPIVAHAIGTLVGALAAYLIAASYKHIFAWVIGVLFLIGGLTACFLIPAPAWFMVVDLVIAYIPMAWLAILAGRKIQGT